MDISSQKSMTVARLSHGLVDASALAWIGLLVFAIVVYALGLDGQYAPTNGDELVYAHIARLTAASQHWLPLVSELDHMRNTKPPLLFWQALVAGDWGRNWSLAALRTPSVIYTVLLALAVAWTVQHISRDLRRAGIAACVYLAFFCTFRFGRTYLTSAPETFWLSLPMFWLLWRPVRPEPASGTQVFGWWTHVCLGLALGLGLAYKSFALVVPAGAALWCAQLIAVPGLTWRVVWQITVRMAVSATVALGVFALWFVLDPDPRAVWQEFVIGENAGKLSSSQGYWHIALLGGGFSIWAQLLAYVQNAGLLAFVVLGLMGLGVKQAWQAWGGRLSPASLSADGLHKISVAILLVWLVVWLLVFTLPSQRSARYVIPAMPALAMLIALYWHQIARGWFLSSLLLCGLFIAVLGRIAWAAHDIGIGSSIELALTMLAVVAGITIVVAGVLRPSWTRACTVVACLGVFACFGLATSPLNGAAGRYDAHTTTELQRVRVAVPNGFNGQFERFQFLLPGNRFEPYDVEGRGASERSSSDAQELNRLLAQYDAVVWLQSQPAQLAPPCVPGCQVLGTRWEVKGRHQSGEITLANVWHPQLWLFRREWLVQRVRPAAP